MFPTHFLFESLTLENKLGIITAMTLLPLNPLTLQVQELFLESGLHPKFISHLLQNMDDYFSEQMLYYSSSLPATIKTLYQLNDNELYSVISVCGVNSYEAVLMPQLQYIVKQISKDTVSLIKSSTNSSEEIRATVQELNRLMKEVLYLLKQSTKTTRKAVGDTGISTEHVEFPEYRVLKEFYECGRKVSYDTFEEALTNLEWGNNAYLCIHCEKYHQGRKSAENTPPISQTMQMSRYKTVWRRHNKI